MSATLLHYRPWRGTFSPALLSVWPVARTALWGILRRRMFWGMYALGMMIFLLFFFGQYLLAWAETRAGEMGIAPLERTEDPKAMIKEDLRKFTQTIRENPRLLGALLRDVLKLNGTGEEYVNFFWYQGYILTAILALAGSVMVGNDLHHGSLPFYLSKPLSRWHYLLGKWLAVGVAVNLLTTLPALALFVQYGLLYSWDYFTDNWRLALGILGYGMVLTAYLSLLLVGTATWLRRTVPLVLAWTTLFVFLRGVASALVDGLHLDAHWRLINLWNDSYLVGHWVLGGDMADVRPQPQPEVYLCALILGGISALCLTYSILRIRAVEVIK